MTSQVYPTATRPLTPAPVPSRHCVFPTAGSSFPGTGLPPRTGTSSGTKTFGRTTSKSRCSLRLTSKKCTQPGLQAPLVPHQLCPHLPGALQISLPRFVELHIDVLEGASSAKVNHHRIPRRSDHDVVRFDVAPDQAVLVQLADSLIDLIHPLALVGSRSARCRVEKRRAVNPLEQHAHEDVFAAIPVHQPGYA